MERHRQIVELSDDCVKEIGLDGTILSVNVGGLRLLGATDPQQVIGKAWRSFWPQESQPMVDRALQLAANGERSEFEGVGADFHGEQKTWHVNVGPIFDNGTVRSFLAVSTDVSARNASYAAAVVLEKALRALSQEAQEKLAEAARREADLLDHLRSSESRLLATNLAYQQLEVRHFEASQRSVFAVAAQKAAEMIAEQAQKGEAVGQMLAGVVHDLNNFLHSATTAIDLAIASGELSPRNTQLLATAEKALQRGAEMSQRLVGFAREHPYRPESVELAALVETMEPLLRQAVGSAVELKIDVCDPGCCALVDRNTLERALLNLVINARDACSEGDHIRVSTGRREVSRAESNASRAAGSYVTLSVSDTGAGMTEEVVARVFEVYFTTKPEGKGSGLGLPQVHSAVGQAGGFITVTSSPGEGSTFELALPKV